MDIRIWIMVKSITESNKMYVKLFDTSVVIYLVDNCLPQIARIMYLLRCEIMQNVMIEYSRYKFQVTSSLTTTVGPEWTGATNIINAIFQRLTFTV